MKNSLLENPANLLKMKASTSFKQIPVDSPLLNHPKFEVEKLNFYYGSLQVLHNISVAIPSGAITSIIGPSGTGKSTFLRLLNRMSDLVANTRVEGHIMLDGKDIFSQISPVDLRYRVGMVFQQPNPFPKTIYDNVAYGPRMHGLKDKKKLDEVVETSLRQSFLWDEVKDQLRLSALSLSGGQQQRLCIARSLAVGPEVLLMDEPCSALDPIATFKIEELILGLSGSYTIILVTHNMQQAARISDYTGVFMLVSGQTSELGEFGRTVEVFTNPKKASTEAYLTGRLG